jgi:hypothetical protein
MHSSNVDDLISRLDELLHHPCIKAISLKGRSYSIKCREMFESLDEASFKRLEEIEREGAESKSKIYCPIKIQATPRIR